MGYSLQIQTSAEQSNFWGISYDALLTGLVPVLLFIVAYIFKRLNENNKEKKRLNEIEEYLKKSIELLKEPLFRQIESLAKLSHSLRGTISQPLRIDHIASYHVQQIKEIDSKDLYKIFIKNKKGNIGDKTELYGKLRACLDYFDAIKKSIANDFSLFTEQYFENEEVYRQNLKILDEFVLVMGSKSDGNLIEKDSFLSELYNIRGNWDLLKKDNVNYTDMQITRKMYIEPVRDLCSKNLWHNYAEFVLKHLMFCIYAYNNIEESKKEFSKDVLLIARRLQNSWFEINDAMKKFDSM